MTLRRGFNSPSGRFLKTSLYEINIVNEMKPHKSVDYAFWVFPISASKGLLPVSRRLVLYPLCPSMNDMKPDYDRERMNQRNYVNLRYQVNSQKG